MKALVISADPGLRGQLAVSLRTLERRTGQPWEFIEAENGVEGLRAAWRELPEIVVVDEIASGAGAFAVAKDLRGQMRPFPGGIVIVLAREQDAWLAKWSGADAWLTRPVDPFALADAALELVGERAEAEAP